MQGELSAALQWCAWFHSLTSAQPLLASEHACDTCCFYPKPSPCHPLTAQPPPPPAPAPAPTFSLAAGMFSMSSLCTSSSSLPLAAKMRSLSSTHCGGKRKVRA